MEALTWRATLRIIALLRDNSRSGKSYQDFVVDTLCKRKPLEDLAEKLKHLCRVLGFDLSFKSIHLVHVVSLMVTCRDTRIISYCAVLF